MLTITTALVALLTPVFFISGVLNAPAALNEYTVDLGYQVNKGQDVTVRTLLCSRCGSCIQPFPNPYYSF